MSLLPEMAVDRSDEFGFPLAAIKSVLDEGRSSFSSTR